MACSGWNLRIGFFRADVNSRFDSFVRSFVRSGLRAADDTGGFVKTTERTLTDGYVRSGFDLRDAQANLS